MSFEHKDYFDARLCFKGDEVKLASILDSYAQNQIDLTDINRIFDYIMPNYSLKKFLIFQIGQKKNIGNIKKRH